MNKIRFFKIIIAVLIAITLFFCFTQNSFALPSSRNIDTMFKGDQSNASNTVGTILGKTLNFIQVIGAGFAILMLVILGIRWIGASPSGKAEIKKASTYYIMGAIFIFAAIGLLQIIKTFTNKNINKIQK